MEGLVTGSSQFLSYIKLDQMRMLMMQKTLESRVSVRVSQLDDLVVLIMSSLARRPKFQDNKSLSSTVTRLVVNGI